MCGRIEHRLFDCAGRDEAEEDIHTASLVIRA